MLRPAWCWGWRGMEEIATVAERRGLLYVNVAKTSPWLSKRRVYLAVFPLWFTAYSDSVVYELFCVCGKVGSLSLLWISLPFLHWSRPFVNHRDKKHKTNLHWIAFCAFLKCYIICLYGTNCYQNVYKNELLSNTVELILKPNVQACVFELVFLHLCVPAGASGQNVHRASKGSPQHRWSEKLRTLCTTFIALPV